MSDNNDGSAKAGSPIIGGPNPNHFQDVGQPQTVEMVPKTQYDELFAKMGQMGNENGEYRKFFDDIAPLLEKLDTMPEVAKAILDEKFDTTLATAILEGKVTVGEAKAVQKAEEKVKKELGKEYKETSEVDIAKLVEKEVEKVKVEIKEREELRDFEQKTADFIANTSDFAEYGDKISTWLDNHVDVTDVETAYYAVKGKLSAEDAAAKAEKAQAEAAKEVAMNASGGAGVATHIRRGTPMVDRLIGGRGNPNTFS